MGNALAVPKHGAYQCSECRYAFDSMAAFERHRIGGARCATLPEMLRRELHPTQRGIWRIPKPTNRYEELSNGSPPLAKA